MPVQIIYLGRYTIENNLNKEFTIKMLNTIFNFVKRQKPNSKILLKKLQIMSFVTDTFVTYTY